MNRGRAGVQRTEGLAARARRAFRVARGPGFFLAWSLVPIQAVPSESGRTRVTVGYGSGEYTAGYLVHVPRTGVGCGGVPYETTVAEKRTAPVAVQAGGAMSEFWPSETARVAIGGSWSKLEWLGPTQNLPEGFEQETTAFTFSALAAKERESWGAGFGFGIHSAGDDTRLLAPIYVRVGDLDQVHVRADLHPVSNAPAHVGETRLGVGYNMGGLRGVRGQISYTGPLLFEAAEGGGATGELWFPIGNRLEAGGMATIRGGERPGEKWTLGAGVAFRPNGD